MTGPTCRSKRVVFHGRVVRYGFAAVEHVFHPLEYFVGAQSFLFSAVDEVSSPSIIVSKVTAYDGPVAYLVVGIPLWQGN